MSSARSRIAAGALAAALLLGGCGDFDGPAVAQGVTRNDLIADLAIQLGHSATHGYEAAYQLAGGGTASITQDLDPARTAYRYPGGMLLVTTTATTRCATSTCTMTAPLAAGALPAALPATLLTDALRAGLVAPSTVLDLLNAAALDPDLTVDQHDTTVAGRHATCVELGDVDAPQTSGFTTCITNEGALGSFAGTLDGKAVDMAMTHYTEHVPANAFAPPPNATMLDHR